MADLADAIYAAALVILGFIFSSVWDVGKEQRQEKASRKRILLMVKMDTDANESICEALLEVQKHGITATAPLSPPTDESRTLVMMNWPILNLDGETGSLVNSAYHFANQLKMLINARNQYTTLMMAMSNYAQTLANMDQPIFLMAKFYVETTHKKLKPLLEKLIGGPTPNGRASGSPISSEEC